MHAYNTFMQLIPLDLYIDCLCLGTHNATLYIHSKCMAFQILTTHHAAILTILFSAGLTGARRGRNWRKQRHCFCGTGVRDGAPGSGAQ